MTIEHSPVWILTQWLEDEGETTWVHATQAGAYQHMTELVADTKAAIEQRDLLLVQGPDSPAPTWYLIEPGCDILVDDYPGSWSIEHQRIFA